MDTTPTGGPPSGEFAEAEPTRELPSLRTRTSTTHEQSDGSYLTAISSGSVNFQEDGAWKPIDNTLVESTAEGFSLENAANRYTLRLPQSLSRPVAVDLDAGRFELGLRDAAGSLERTDADSATYAEALPGVDVTYSSLHDSVKEEILLHSRESQRRLVYDITVPRVLADRFTTRANDDGSIDFLATSGELLFRLTAPYMYEQVTGPGVNDGPVAMAFDKSPTGGTLTVTTNDEWLDAPQRQFPVVVDPDLLLVLKNCNIVNGDQANANNCAPGNLRVGYNGTYKRRALVKFEVGGIPSNAQVLGSEMQLYAQARINSTPVDIQARPLEETWSDDVTWNKRNSATNWQSPGGSFNGSAGYEQHGISQLGQYYSWYLTRVAQGWVNGDRPNLGVVVKQRGETTNNIIDFRNGGLSTSSRARLFISWDREGRGERDLYTTEDERLNDRASLEANVVSGNLLGRADDLSITGRGIDLAVGRYYNSRPFFADGGSSTGAFGPNWTMNAGADMGLQVLDEATVVLHAPSGYKVPFTRPAPDGDYVHPPGFYAELREVSGGFELEFDKSHVIWEFSSGGRLTRISDGTSAVVSGEHLNHIDFAYDTSNRLSSITDTRGRVTEFSYHPTLGFVEEMEDPAGRIFSYGYSSGRLSSYTDPDLGVTSYTYDSNGNLDHVTTPEGSESELTYDSAHRIKTIKRITDPVTGAGDTKSFTYNVDNTVVTDERSNDTTFKYFDSAVSGDPVDAQHRELGLVRLVTDAAGNKSSSQYTTDANVVSYGGANLANQEQTTLSYDEGTGNVTGATLPTGAASSFSYNSDHTPADATDPQGNIYASTTTTPTTTSARRCAARRVRTPASPSTTSSTRTGRWAGSRTAGGR